MFDPMDSVHVVFAVDRDFLPFTAVASWSALQQTAGSLHIHVLHDGRLGRSGGRLEKLVTAGGGRVTFYTVDKGRLAGLPVTDHVSLATYYRLSIADLLPQSIGRVIYLDGDLIVRTCLTGLYQWPTGQRGVAVVPEPSDSAQRLGLPAGTPYFNAGVLVLDLDLWRRESVTDELYQIASLSREKLLFWDQDVLALFLQGQFSKLPPHWNVTHRYFFGTSRLPMPVDPPAIVHFSGAGLKPWNSGHSHPYADEFWQLADQVKPFGLGIRRPDRFRLLEQWRNRLGRRRAA